MNIGSLFKNIIGDAKPGEIKQVDLKAGQVVRGVVQSVSEDGKEAVLQIQGVKVNAKLETPLQAGQTSFMQVQPAAEDGSIVLKPVAAPPGAAAGAQSMEDTLKQVGLPDNKPNRELIRMMQQADIPVTREQTTEVRNLLAQKPAAVDAQQWVRSIGILQQRGLPLTPQSVAGMQQAVFGPPASALLQNLEQHVAAALSQFGEASGDEAAGSGRPNVGAQAANAAASAAAPAAGNAAPAGGSGVPAPNAGAAPAGTAAPAGSPANPAAAGAAAPADGEQSPPLAARTAAQAEAGAAPGAGAAAEAPAAAQAAGRTAPAAGTAGAASAPAAAAQPAAQPSAATANGQPAPAAAGTAAPGEADAALLRKVQALLDELRSAAAGGTAAAGSSPASAAQGAPQQAQADAAEGGPWVGRLLKMLGAEHEHQAARATLLNAAPPAPAAQPAAQTPPASAQGQTAQPPGTPPAQTQPQQTPPVSAQAQTAAAPAAAAANTDTPDSLSAAVRTAAEQALRGLQGELGRPESAASASEARSAQTAGTPQLAEVRENLKSLLLQLSASDSLPPALKDAAQQAVQQMTGQQLLLNTDRTAPFAQVTMFLPFVGPDGNQTASVQIESRRGSKGELDASNCRLWFDLDMKSLGRTVIDVQVVDRKVSLNFRNDEEWARPLLEAGQPQIASALDAAGYQLMALRTDALPERTAAAGETGTSLSFVPQAYRGVDVKI
ncbi:flagellar hook-length control protein FliK [Saccharibacillus brassicae]|uniref:Flagellar hook-length control protein FliK n=1 Tax=Saccharibacillus brassicae TaxID=2583377 RepID=A0A4Y6V3A1_SACBS|nr:flagellar hook-length control protein FliK [Saccharibacillus brassicae]QDH23854.1 flagellar hook-length control protein FliK [Saccharibacillus brassicae]